MHPAGFAECRLVIGGLFIFYELIGRFFMLYLEKVDYGGPIAGSCKTGFALRFNNGGQGFPLDFICTIPLGPTRNRLPGAKHPAV
jgi:hypothetical protein